MFFSIIYLRTCICVFVCVCCGGFTGLVKVTKLYPQILVTTATTILLCECVYVCVCVL